MTYEEEKAVELLTSKNTDMQPLGLWLLVSLGWSPSAIAQAYIKWCKEKNYRYILWNNKEYPSNHWKNRIILSGETSKFYLDDIYHRLFIKQFRTKVQINRIEK